MPEKHCKKSVGKISNPDRHMIGWDSGERPDLLLDNENDEMDNEMGPVNPEISGAFKVRSNRSLFHRPHPFRRKRSRDQE